MYISILNGLPRLFWFVDNSYRKSYKPGISEFQEESSGQPGLLSRGWGRVPTVLARDRTQKPIGHLNLILEVACHSSAVLRWSHGPLWYTGEGTARGQTGHPWGLLAG